MSGSISDYFDVIDWNSGYSPFARIFLYPYNDAVSNEWIGYDGPVSNAAVDGVQQLVNSDAIDGFEVLKLKDSETFIEEDDNVANDDSSKGSFIDAFETYTDNNPDYYQFTGLHYGIGGGFDGGGGFSNDELEELSFQTNGRMIIGAGSGNVDRVKTFTKQELVHAYSAYNYLESNTNLVDSGSHMHEHDTGLVYTSGEISPMAITYHDSHARHASCDNGRSDILGYNPYYTSCTKQAVKKCGEEIY